MYRHLYGGSKPVYIKSPRHLDQEKRDQETFMARSRARGWMVILVALSSVRSIRGNWSGWKEGNAVFALSRWVSAASLCLQRSHEKTKRGRRWTGEGAKTRGGGRLFSGSMSGNIQVWRKQELRPEDISLSECFRFLVLLAGSRKQQPQQEKPCFSL